MRKAIEKQYGSLKTLTLEGASGGPCVVLFHGYGADAADLLPLHEIMGLSKDVTWVFPEASMEVIIAPGFYGKAWFQIDNKRLENSIRTGVAVDMSTSTPAGIEGARKAAISLYSDLLKKHSRVVLGGFSQGAMLATEVSLYHPQKPAGLIIMSGTLICKDRWLELASSCAGLKFIQSHGKNDAILGYEFAENLLHLLNDAGLDGEFISFNGGHEIPQKVIERIGKFLSSIFSRK